MAKYRLYGKRFRIHISAIFHFQTVREVDLVKNVRGSATIKTCLCVTRYTARVIVKDALPGLREITASKVL